MALGGKVNYASIHGTIAAQQRIEKLLAANAALEDEISLQKDVILSHQPAIGRLHAVIEAMDARITELEAEVTQLQDEIKTEAGL